MGDLKTCPKCNDFSDMDTEYCTCGHRFGEDDDFGADPSDIAALAGPPGYSALRVAVVLLQVCAVILGLLAVLGFFQLGKSVPVAARLIYIGEAAVKCFLVWVSGDVIRILLDIRGGQEA